METPSAVVSGTMPVVYCIGDSHVCFFSGQDTIHPLWPHVTDDRLPWFKTHRIGASLAYNLSHEGTRTRGRERLFEVLDTKVPAGAHVLLSFGEIDCRAHLVKQARIKGLPIGTVVDMCLDEYFKVVKEIADRGFRVIVYNVVPSRVSMLGGATSRDDNKLVTSGTLLERNHAASLFNEGARRRCATCGARFLENFSRLVDGRGRTIRWFFWDSIHLSQRAMPVTLEALRMICPEMGIPTQLVKRPGVMAMAADEVRRRFDRIVKALIKIPRIFGAS